MQNTTIKPQKAFNSLLGRFALASFLILPLFIIISGTLLLESFQYSQIKAEQESLQSKIYLLLSVSEVENNQLAFPGQLAEPRLNQANSGLYGFVFDQTGKELWRSASAQWLPEKFIKHFQPFILNQRIIGQQFNPENNNTFNTLSYDIEWIDDNNQSLPLRFVIANNSAALATEIKNYRSHLWKWLGVMGVGLIMAQILIMRWGLRPLKKLSRQLFALQHHKIDQLDSNYPVEIQPIISNFNHILQHEKQQRERYRNTMSDLAHSLKTPLAVIQSHLSQEKASPIGDQVDRINQIVSHQLQRAVVKVNQSPIKVDTSISINSVSERLINTLKKVYQQKNIKFHRYIDENALFYGDESDLLEILGNIMDNACKHGQDEVTITANYTPEGTTRTDQKLLIGISDNGQGINSDTHETILQRGARADTAQPGQGLGLSIAVDIISSYGGELQVKNNAPAPHLPGACFYIIFNNQQR